eukprot:RCo052374
METETPTAAEAVAESMEDHGIKRPRDDAEGDALAQPSEEPEPKSRHLDQEEVPNPAPADIAEGTDAGSSPQAAGEDEAADQAMDGEAEQAHFGEVSVFPASLAEAPPAVLPQAAESSALFSAEALVDDEEESADEGPEDEEPAEGEAGMEAAGAEGTESSSVLQKLREEKRARKEEKKRLKAERKEHKKHHKEKEKEKVSKEHHKRKDSEKDERSHHHRHRHHRHDRHQGDGDAAQEEVAQPEEGAEQVESTPLAEPPAAEEEALVSAEQPAEGEESAAP